MNKRVSSRAIIIKDNKLVVLFRRRIRDGKVVEYYSLPGGGLEEGETLEENMFLLVLNLQTAAAFSCQNPTFLISMGGNNLKGLSPSWLDK